MGEDSLLSTLIQGTALSHPAATSWPGLGGDRGKPALEGNFFLDRPTGVEVSYPVPLVFRACSHDVSCDWIDRHTQPAAAA